MGKDIFHYVHRQGSETDNFLETKNHTLGGVKRFRNHILAVIYNKESKLESDRFKVIKFKFSRTNSILDVLTKSVRGLQIKTVFREITRKRFQFDFE